MNRLADPVLGGGPIARAEIGGDPGKLLRRPGSNLAEMEDTDLPELRGMALGDAADQEKRVGPAIARRVQGDRTETGRIGARDGLGLGRKAA
ncbi:MAG: hypothetical protein J0H20_08915 [Rhizobiales bacterium]|nr:hypothetical protein [Hyphomicrobiales bacterium]